MKFSVEKEDIIKLLFTLYYKEVYTEDCPGCHHCS